MSTVSSIAAQREPHDLVGRVPRARVSAGKIFARAIVILIGIAVGLFLAVFIALFTGWISIRC